jgi:PKD repeat protein
VGVLDGDAGVATTESGDDGSYTVEVEPGTYTLRASKPGFATGESSVTVERGETTAADVVLQGETNRTTVRLAPVEQRVGIDQTSRYEVVVTGADDGIGSYEFVARVGETGTATITDATLKGTSGDGALSSVEVADDGTSATVLTAAADLTEGTTTTIATLAVEGVAPGTTDISLDDIVVGDSQSRGYTIENVSGASVTVEEMAPVVVGDQPATDPDGDGLYEDINGDGTFDIVDVSALFRNRNSDTIQNDPEGLDFNGDGIVDIVDISKLFDEA